MIATLSYAKLLLNIPSTEWHKNRTSSLHHNIFSFTHLIQLNTIAIVYPLPIPKFIILDEADFFHESVMKCLCSLFCRQLGQAPSRGLLSISSYMVLNSVWASKLNLTEPISSSGISCEETNNAYLLSDCKYRYWYRRINAPLHSQCIVLLES